MTFEESPLPPGHKVVSIIYSSLRRGHSRVRRAKRTGSKMAAFSTLVVVALLTLLHGGKEIYVFPPQHRTTLVCF